MTHEGAASWITLGGVIVEVELGFPGKLHAWHVGTWGTRKQMALDIRCTKLGPRRHSDYLLHSS